MQTSVEVLTATPDLLEEAASASLANHTRQNTLFARSMRKLFGACAYCVTTGGSGFLAGHLGCVVTPIITTLTPAGVPLIGYDPYDPVTMLKIGFALNAAVLGAWYGLRGRHVAKPIRVATIAIATSSLLITTAIKTPHMYDMGQAYQTLTQDDPEKRAMVINNARLTGQSLDEYLMSICSSPNSPTAGMSAFDKIRAAFTPR
jgi:hypothetical protein